MSVSDGSVSLRFKSSISCDTIIFGSGVSGDYIVIVGYCSGYFLMVMNIATNVFTTKTFPQGLLGVGVETATGRFVISGDRNPM